MVKMVKTLHNIFSFLKYYSEKLDEDKIKSFIKAKDNKYIHIFSYVTSTARRYICYNKTNRSYLDPNKILFACLKYKKGEWVKEPTTKKEYIKNFFSTSNTYYEDFKEWYPQWFDETLEELCQESIKERINGLRTGFFGGGRFMGGKSTALKDTIVEMTNLDFEIVRRYLDSLVQVKGWANKGMTRDKYQEYLIFTRPKDYEKYGYTDQYFIQEYGHIYKELLLKEIKGHKHKKYTKNQQMSFGHISEFEREYPFDKSGKLQWLCRMCDKWIDKK